jgi:hypothetical protein
MPTATLTVNLPSEEIEFLEAYARDHGLTATEVVARYLQRLKSGAQSAIHPEVAALTGLVPKDVDAVAEYHQHLLNKQRWKFCST